MKILLVEDHPGLAEMTCRLLREVYEHEVGHAATGAEALEELPKLQPELVLVDINLPDTNGYELARRIRALPQAQGMVLIAVSGFGNILDDESTRDAGFDAYFRKPMDFDLLPALLRRSRP